MDGWHPLLTGMEMAESEELLRLSPVTPEGSLGLEFFCGEPHQLLHDDLQDHLKGDF